MASSMPQGPAPEDLGGGLTCSDLIVASLEDLKAKDFERFRDKLSDFSYNDKRPVPRGLLENANRVATKNLLIDCYGEAGALDVTIKVLKSISLMGPAQELQIRIGQHVSPFVDGVIKSSGNRLEDFRKRYMALMKERYWRHRDGNSCLGETVHLDKRFSHCLFLINEHEEKLPHAKSSLEGLFTRQPGIQKLVLYECSLKSNCCADLYPVITSRSLVLLDLSRNYLQDSGIKLLCNGLREKDCNLQVLRLRDCGLTSGCCSDLSAVISTNRTFITLDLSKNSLDEVGLKDLCQGLRHPGCTLQDLRFEACGFSPSCCEDLADIILASPSLRSLDLSSNDLLDSGVRLLCRGLQHPQCALQELSLKYCGLTTSCCDDLRCIITSSRSLKKLLLKGNGLRNAGISLLCEGLRDPGCALQELRLESCGLTSYRCEDMRSVITTNRSLVELDLTLNSLSDSGINSLCEGLSHPGCTLRELWVTVDGITTNLILDSENKKPKRTFLQKWFGTKPGKKRIAFTPKTSSR